MRRLCSMSFEFSLNFYILTLTLVRSVMSNLIPNVKIKLPKSARFKMDEVTRDSVVIGHFCDKQNYL